MVNIALVRFPPFGVIIAGFLVGFISAKSREGTIMAGFLAVLGAIVQLAAINVLLGNIIPFAKVDPSVLLVGFDGLSAITAIPGLPPWAQVYLLYFLFGALGGFLGSLVK